MCKPFRDYLTLTREYTREIITFGGFALVWLIIYQFVKRDTERVNRKMRA